MTTNHRSDDALIWTTCVVMIVALLAFVAEAYCAPAELGPPSPPTKRVLPDDPIVVYPTHGVWQMIDGQDLLVRCPAEIPAAGEVPAPGGCPAPVPAWFVSFPLRSELEGRIVRAEGSLQTEQERVVHAMDATARAIRACEVRMQRCADGARLLAAATDGKSDNRVWLASGLGIVAGAGVALLLTWVAGGF